MIELIQRIWPHLVALFTLAATAAAISHAVLRKHDVRAAIGWVVFILVTPVVGPIVYLILGVNRINRRAAAIRERRLAGRQTPYSLPIGHEAIALATGLGGADLSRLAGAIDRLVSFPLVAGNTVTPLTEGETAYRSMLAVIAEARSSIALSTYIFDNDSAGERFVAALAAAVERGVEVRVLVDAVGARYSWPSVLRRLHRAGVPASRFLPTLLPWRMPYLNLRNHRKILVADGTVGFTGGMNIRAGHAAANDRPDAIRDLHFRVVGPVVTQLQAVFAEDWKFATGEELDGPLWFPEVSAEGPTVARVIPDGPDDDFEKLRWALLSALACARERVRIVTPYFLPDTGVVTALAMTARRGVAVDIILPERSNLTLVQWAMQSQLPRVLEAGCRVWLTPPPFDHAKLMVVDSAWTLIGSANWDARSLRLNFELDLECYDDELACRLEEIAVRRRSAGRELTLDEATDASLPLRLRNGLVWLFSPYL